MNDNDLAALTWLEMLANYEKYEYLTYQEPDEEVELYLMDVDDPSDDVISWDEHNEFKMQWDNYKKEWDDNTYNPGYAHNFHLGAGEA